MKLTKELEPKADNFENPINSPEIPPSQSGTGLMLTLTTQRQQYAAQHVSIPRVAIFNVSVQLYTLLRNTNSRVAFTTDTAVWREYIAVRRTVTTSGFRVLGGRVNDRRQSIPSSAQVPGGDESNRTEQLARGCA